MEPFNNFVQQIYLVSDMFINLVLCNRLAPNHIHRELYPLKTLGCFECYWELKNQDNSLTQHKLVWDWNLDHETVLVCFLNGVFID